MAYNNLSKLFRYVGADGQEIIFDYTNGYLISKPTGIDTLSVSVNESYGINQVGTSVSSEHVESRPVTITGRVVGDSQEQRKKRLLDVIRPGAGRLYCDDYYLDVRTTETPTVGPDRSHAQFQVSFLAPHPYWCRENKETGTLMGVEKLFKFPWNISKPYQFGRMQQKKFVNIRNQGQADIPFTVAIIAMNAVSVPVIQNIVDGKFLRINKNMVAGERIVIEITHSRTYVTSSVDGDCRGALDIESSLFRLAPGDNLLKPTATSGLENLQMEITFAPEMMGMSV